MRPRSILLTAIAGVVAVGGIYLWLDVRGSDAAGPSPEKLAEAQARHESGAAGGAAERSGHRFPRTGDGSDPPVAVRSRLDLPHPRANLPMNDPAVFDQPPPIDPPDRLRGSGAMQPPIDPDDPELASGMTETNKMYDRGDYDGARALALKLLSKEPGNKRMLRVIVSSSCILGDSDVAQKFWAQLPTADQAQMSIRCARYQVSFPATAPEPMPPTEK
ncbi:MAG TPA: hypothetical protein VHE35_13225 [Kofleriaceae bacterium]|nr:hypothetical protein [Kofleriaceae bacterium]